MDGIQMTYVFNACVIMGLTIFSSVFNIREVSKKKCEDRKTMRNYMYLAISVMVWTFASNMLFYFRERIGMEFYSFGNWDRLPYMAIGSAVVLAVFIFFTALNIDLTRNDTNRYLSICKNLNVSGLAKSGISKKSTASKVKDIFSYKSRLDTMYSKWGGDEKPEMTRKDVDEWNALSAYHNSIHSDLETIDKTFGRMPSTFKSEWSLVSDTVYKDSAKNWLKDMNTYPDDETAFKEAALLTDMYKSAGCQELRFYDFVLDNTSDMNQLNTQSLSELHSQFKEQESELYSDSLKAAIDDTFLTSFKSFVGSLSNTTPAANTTTTPATDTTPATNTTTTPATDTSPATNTTTTPATNTTTTPATDTTISAFTGKYVGNDFLKPGDKTCKDANKPVNKDKIHKHALHIDQITSMAKDILSKYTALKNVFNDATLKAYDASVAIQDDYLRRRIISGFVWCMVLWPSLQSHDFVSRMYTVFGTEGNQYVFFISSVLLPVMLGLALFGGKDARKQVSLKNISAIIKEIQNAKL